eukprot:9375119-Pyramimonas_sp.AAC.1
MSKPDPPKVTRSLPSAMPRSCVGAGIERGYVLGGFALGEREREGGVTDLLANELAGFEVGAVLIRLVHAHAQPVDLLLLAAQVFLRLTQQPRQLRRRRLVSRPASTQGGAPPLPRAPPAQWLPSRAAPPSASSPASGASPTGAPACAAPPPARQRAGSNTVSIIGRLPPILVLVFSVHLCTFASICTSHRWTRARQTQANPFWKTFGGAQERA